MGEPRRLILMRHAHAEAGHGDDHARELSARGLEEAGRAARWLCERALLGPGGATLVHSTATRTTQTAQALIDVGDIELEVVARPDLYLAAPERLLAVAAELPDACAVAVLVAHNPGMADLVGRLARRAGAAAAPVAFVPASVAVFEFGDGWSDLAGAQPRLVDHFRP